MAMYERRSSTESDHSEEAVSPGTARATERENLQIHADPTTSANPDSMDRFHQRVKNELMYELRHLQHGERPVTGQNHREHLQQFMAKHLVKEESVAAGAGKGNIPANVDSVEQHRPEAILVEVQGIVEQRPVSSVLQSAAFRRQLENVLRGSVFNTRRQVLSEVSNRRRESPRASPVTTTAAQSSNTNLSSPPEAVRSVPAPRRQLVRSESTESVESFSSARSSLEEDIENDVDEEEVTESPRTLQPVQPSELPAPARQPEHAIPRAIPQVPSERRTENSPREADSEIISWNDISRIHQEELVDEISELVHRRLVTTTLESEFRATLEVLAQEHLSSSGTNGQAVENFIRALPNTGVPRNDFSHLGIVAGQEGDNWDNISVTSVSAHSVPYVQTNTYLGREIQSLKSQMNEMKNMLKLTFDLQMDIQRAVRQEVAAAMGQFAGQGAAAFPAPSAAPSRPVCEGHCLICLEKETDSVLYQCGHMCVCYICGRDLVSRGHNCPVCRAPIKDVIRSYRTSVE